MTKNTNKKSTALTVTEAAQTTETTKKKEAAKPICSLAEVEKISKENNLTTVSARIRYFDSLGHSRSAIAKTLNKRYQHVRNVLVENVQTNK